MLPKYEGEMEGMHGLYPSVQWCAVVETESQSVNVDGNDGKSESCGEDPNEKWSLNGIE